VKYGAKAKETELQGTDKMTQKVDSRNRVLQIKEKQRKYKPSTYTTTATTWKTDLNVSTTRTVDEFLLVAGRQMFHNYSVPLLLASTSCVRHCTAHQHHLTPNTHTQHSHLHALALCPEPKPSWLGEMACFLTVSNNSVCVLVTAQGATSAAVHYHSVLRQHYAASSVPSGPTGLLTTPSHWSDHTDHPYLAMSNSVVSDAF